LNSAGFGKTRPNTDGPLQLGQALSVYMEQRVLPKYQKYGGVFDAWQQLLPDELAKHCRIDAIKAGQLTVAVDSPAYMHELRLCSGELLEQLQQFCPKARIRKIKLLSE